MSRLSLALSTCALVLPSAALAQGETTGDITMELRIQDTEGGFRFPNPMEEVEYFNRVRCECNSEFQIRYRLADGIDPATYDGEQVDIYFGAQCTDPDFRIDCLLTPEGINDYGDLQTVVDRSYSVREIIALDEAGACPDEDGTNTIFALVDPEGDGAFESTSTLGIPYDTRAPGLPEDLEVRGGEEAVIVSFDLEEADDDIQQYQVLCASVDAPTTAVKEDPSDALYDRVGDGDFEDCASDFEISVLNGSADVPAGLASLDPAFICGTASRSATAIRVDGLDNGVPYHVVLVAVDGQRNASATYLGIAEPRPAVDFWELYKDGGGSAEGGCNSGGPAGWLVALLFGGLLLRLRRKGTALIALLLVVAVPVTASAQPYWDELEAPIEESGPNLPSWNVGIKLGPYTPTIDDEFSGEGPFEQTFGKKNGLMTQVDVEYFFSRSFGQLGVGLMLGFHRKSARAFEVIDGELVRTEDEKTSFRLFPVTVSAVYRLTQLDDRYGIPVVPYGKFGLAYYYWQITKPGGDIARSDEGGKGRGGSLGWQGSLGLAVRAERIDADAAASLRNEFGVDHAGFYAELNLAQVDGFGSSSKLSVGDFTWFGGVNFEF